MSKTKKSISEIITEIALPIAKNLGLELWDIKFLKEGPNWYLRVFIDKPNGPITIDDCEVMSKNLDEPLDLLNPIEQSYCLEVCSPGIERELLYDNHLKKFIGHDIRIKFFKPNENGKKSLSGKLVSFDENFIFINDLKISRKDISCINLKMLEEF